MSNHDFDIEIREKMSQHEAPVPTDAWNAIANKKKKRRRYMLIWWIPILLAIFFGVHRFAHKSGNGSEVLFNAKNVGNEYQQKPSETETKPATTTIEQNNTERKENQTNILVEVTNKENVAEIVTNGNEEDGNNVTIASAAQQKDPDFLRADKNVANGMNPAKQSSSAYSQSQEEINFSFGNNKVKNHKQKSGNDQDSQNAAKEYLSSLSELANNETGKKSNPGQDYAMQVINYNGRLINYQKSSLNIEGLLNTVEIQKSTFNQTVKNEINKNRKISKRSRWSLEAGFMGFIPVRMKQDIIAINRTTTEPMHIAEFNGNRVTINLQSSTAGFISVRKSLNRKISIGVGLQYGTIKEEIFISGNETNLKSQVVQRLENGSSGPQLVYDTITVASTGSREIDALNSYRFVDIPVSMHFTLLQNSKLSLSLTAAMNIGLYSLYNNSIQGELKPVYANGNLHKNNLQTLRTEFSAGLRIGRPLFMKTEIFAEPYLRFSTSGYKKTIMNHNAIHQVGIGLGVSHKF